LHLRPSRFELAQQVVRPDEMADIEAHELDSSFASISRIRSTHFTFR
jgi:hypothetical protein